MVTSKQANADITSVKNKEGERGKRGEEEGRMNILTKCEEQNRYEGQRATCWTGGGVRRMEEEEKKKKTRDAPIHRTQFGNTPFLFQTVFCCLSYLHKRKKHSFYRIKCTK